MRYPASTYRQVSVQSATPVGLVVMLYDGAIAAIQRAMAAIDAKDIEKKCAHLGRLDGIIAQLEGSLDFERGGQVAQTLKLFYMHARGQSLKANIENSKEILAALAHQFATVREAWEQVEHPTSPLPTTSASEDSTYSPSSAPGSSSWRLSG
jgi:flagellar secretion chaperone FliS